MGSYITSIIGSVRQTNIGGGADSYDGGWQIQLPGISTWHRLLYSAASIYSSSDVITTSAILGMGTLWAWA